MKPLMIKPNDKETIESTIQTLSSRISPELRDEAKKAFEAEMQGDLDKVQEICVRLLDTEQGGKEPELLMLYGRCLFMKGSILTARTVFRDTIALIPDEAMPRIYHALCLHAIGYHASAAKEFDNLYPLDIYHPFFYTAYGDCLQHTERYEESREIFAEEIKYYKSTNTIVLPEILDSAFQHLLYLDIYLNNEHYDNDLDTYYNFLEEIEFTESMQKHVAATLVYLCRLNNRNWYWNKFTNLLDHIRDKGYLTLSECQQTLASAYAGLETFKHEKDSNMAPLWHSFFNACYEKHYMALDSDIMPKSEKENILATYFSCVWYMCNYYEEHKEECAYLKETYPCLYEIAEPVLAEIEASTTDAKENALIHLLKYVSAGTERFRLEKDLQNKYDMIMTASKNSTLGEGSTYERDLVKINRNAPCPCGSGKKYKKCCGKN